MRRIGLAALIVLTTWRASANPIQDENARPGSADWKLGTVRSTDIEGYASLTSVNIGGSISFFVTTTAASYTLEIYRLGYYAGKGGRLLAGPVTLTGHAQPVPAPDPVTGLIECQWSDPYTITIPSDWVSGVFLVKLIAQPGGQANWIMFVVRDDDRASDLLFQSSVTTMQAYNAWGGKSLYGFNSSGGVAASAVSFDRPYGAGAGFTEFDRWEFPTVRFLEKEGYDLTYCTSIDTHANGALLLRHRGFLSVGHDEYWSYEIRRNIEHAREAGVSLGFLSSNTSYWQIRVQPDSHGQPDRTIVSYKERALANDPVLADGDPTNDYLTTTRFRDPPVNLPEETLIGSMWSIADSSISGDIVVENTSSWVFAGTNLHDGDHLPGLLGYEVDRMFSDFPPRTVRLAHSPHPGLNGATDYSDMTIYQAGSGAWVFATGSMDWAYGLDDTGPHESPTPPGGFLNAAAQQITRNVLNRFITNPPPPHDRRRSVGHH